MPSTDTKQGEVKVREFTGLTTNSDPHDLPPGAAIAQVNVTSAVPGELRVRLGTAVVKFN